MIISKSKYCRGYQCPKMLWMDENKPEEAKTASDDTVLKTGNEVGELARNYFGHFVTVQLDSNREKMVAQTKEYIEAGEDVIAEASFMYDDNFCSVDMLKMYEDGSACFVEVKSSTEIHDIHYQDMAFQYYVLSHCGLKMKGVYNLHLNSQYVRQGELDLQQLFVMEDVTEKVVNLQQSIEHNLTTINSCIDSVDEPDIEIDVHCCKPYECDYYAYCHKNVPEQSVFNIHGMTVSKKYDLYKQGIVTYEDIMKQKPKISEKQLKQVKTNYYKEQPTINKTEIAAFLETITYPLYYLDFETYQQAIPQFDGVKPYAQIPFQYSLHVEKYKGVELEHYEFLGKEGEDPRRTLAERLCQDIPLNVCTLAYNMGFEKGRIKEMAELFPDLAEHLLNIHDNIKDLMIPFQKQHYYCEELQGSYSIKYVLPALCSEDPELDYHALEGIHNGSEAMNAFADLPNHTPEEIAQIRKNLLAYCRLDTLAMVKVLEKLEEMVK